MPPPYVPGSPAEDTTPLTGALRSAKTSWPTEGAAAQRAPSAAIADVPVRRVPDIYPPVPRSVRCGARVLVLPGRWLELAPCGAKRRPGAAQIAVALDQELHSRRVVVGADRVTAGERHAGTARADAVRVVLGRTGGQQPDPGTPTWAAQPCWRCGCSCRLQVAGRGAGSTSAR